MKFQRYFQSAIPVFALLLGWEIFSRLGILNPVLLSRPSEIFLTMWFLLNTKSLTGHSVLLTHIYVSLYRLFCAISIATAFGISLGILMGINKYINAYFDPLISITMPIPGIAWAPIFMLWLGYGSLTIVTVGTLAAFFPIVYNTAAGVRSIEKQLIWATETMGADKKTVFLKVLLPWAAPYILTGFRLGLARGWRTVIAVEMIAASIWGLGFMIFDAREFIQTSVIYGGIMILALIFFLIENTFVRLVEKNTVEKWGMIKSTEVFR
ncbi:MAG: ABC transporter permease [Candidatus Hydrothermarchaeota archaeon]